MATSIDDNAADEKSGKSIWRLLNIHCTRFKSLIVQARTTFGTFDPGKQILNFHCTSILISQSPLPKQGTSFLIKKTYNRSWL